MIGFIVIAVLMLAAALAWIVVPLVRRHGDSELARHVSNVAILRDQLRDLEADRVRGLIGEEHFQQAREEIQRRVLEEGVLEDAPKAAERSTPVVTAVLGAVVPVAALLLYLSIGSPVLIEPQPANAPHAGEGQIDPQQLAELAGKLAARLEREPGNVEGWIMLGRSYYTLQKFEDAAKAYARAVDLAPDNANLLADYADVLGAVQGGTLVGRPRELIDRALKADPDHWKALALAGTEAFSRKDYARAVVHWEKLRAQAPAGSEFARTIEASIAEARELGGIRPGAAPLANAGPGAAADGAGPASGSAPRSAAAGTVSGTIRLDGRLAAQAGPEDTVFVFARAAEGPRMPLAIVKTQVKNLPFAFKLDDSMAMAPTARLSGAASVVVGARISKSGNATPQTGDLEGASKPVAVGAQGIEVVIDSARP